MFVTSGILSGKSLISSIPTMLFFAVILFYMIVLGSHILFSLIEIKKYNDSFVTALSPFYLSKNYKSRKVADCLRKVLLSDVLHGKVQAGCLMMYVLTYFVFLAAASFYPTDIGQFLSFFLLAIPFIVNIISIGNYLTLQYLRRDNKRLPAKSLCIILVRHALLGTAVLEILMLITLVMYCNDFTESLRICIFLFVCCPLMLGVTLTFQSIIWACLSNVFNVS